MDKIKMTLYYAYSHSADIVQDDGRIIESRLHYNVLIVNGVNFFGETEEMELNIGEENTNIFRFQFLHSFKINGIIFGVFLSDEKEENLIIKIQDILESHNHSDFSLQDHDIEEIFDFELKKLLRNNLKMIIRMALTTLTNHQTFICQILMLKTLFKNTLAPRTRNQTKNQTKN